MARGAGGWARTIALVAVPGLLLAACSSGPEIQSSSSYPEGRGIGSYRVGVPYRVNGVWYYPAVDYNYDRTGTASWYGEEFEGRLTANGEIFDLNELTAAHTTLPMPSIVEVTNLENGRELQLRVNDRGPFAGSRLIDVSRRAAQLLGFEEQGTTLVRVRILKEESIAAAEEAMHNSGQIMVADATPSAAPRARPVPSHASPSNHLRPAMPTMQLAAAAPRSTPMQTRPPHRATLPPVVMARAEPAAARVPPHTAAPPTQLALANLPVTYTSAVTPPAPRQAPSPRYRFSLISRAEAAEPPPTRRPAEKPALTIDALLAEKASATPRPATAARAPIGRIFVQAGAFARRDNAERVEAHIAHLGHVQVMAASAAGAALYRVRIGPVETAAQADRLLARVVESGYRQARIVGD